MSDERLVAWGDELRRVHQRLRDALDVAREPVEDGAEASAPSRELLLFCRGFCTALAGHHRGEDGTLFPHVLAARPDLAEVIARLSQDHSMLDHLLAGLEQVVTAGAAREVTLRHLDGIEAVMETHFGYEERQLLGALGTLRIKARPDEVLGPL